MPILIAEIVRRHEVHGRIQRSGGRRLLRDDAVRRRPGRVEVVIDGGVVRLWRHVEMYAAFPKRPRREAHARRIPIRPVRCADGQRPDAGAAARHRRHARHHQRLSVGPRRGERALAEHLSRIVEPVRVERPLLQAAVPQLDAAVRAGRNETTRQAHVSHRPRRDDGPCRDDQHREMHDGRSRSKHERDRGQPDREQQQIRPNLHRGAREESARREPPDVPPLLPAHERRHARDEEHRADGIGCLRRCIDRVERAHADDQRSDERFALAHTVADGRVHHQRHRAIQQHLDDQRDPLTIAERAVEHREERRISPRHLQGRVELASRERQTEPPVVVEAFPSPRMRRLDEDECETESDARGGRGQQHRAPQR